MTCEDETCQRCGGNPSFCGCGFDDDDGPPIRSSWPDGDAWDCYHRIRGIERADLRREADREQVEQERILFPWLDEEG